MIVCQHHECQTTAGCVHRGPRGEHCYFGQESQWEITIHQQAARIKVLEARLREADTACFKLCANHGFATGHGDTVVAMIEEIDAQISARAALDKDTGE